MQRYTIFALVTCLIVSLAAPAGAVIATDQAVYVMEGTDQTLIVPVGMSEQAPIGTVSIAADALQPLAEEFPGVVISPNPPIVVLPAPEPLPASPLIIAAYQTSGVHVHAVQLYNNTSALLPLDGFSLLIVTGDEEYEIMLADGWVEPRSYMVLAWQSESVYADMEFAIDAPVTAQLQSIELHHVAYQPVTAVPPVGYGGQLLHRFKSTAGNYTANTTFSPGATTVSGGGLYVLPEVPELSVREVLVNPRSCVVGQEAPDCYDYIKLRNDGAEPIDLGQYRLRSGYSNTNSTSSNTVYFADVLAPGETRTLAHGANDARVSFTANDGTVWLEDKYGFATYMLGVPPYADSDKVAQVGRSWAYNDDTGAWQWATPAPFATDNDFTVIKPGRGSGATPRELVPCKDGQYRSEETNRCRSIALAGGTLKPCREDQYRSEETNRCRSIASAAASVSKPCADDQFRNPATNRCKKIASIDELADCGEGRERNPKTNRCRNVLTSTPPTAGFAVEPITDAANVFVGWWVLGGITVLALGYAGWEWREEVSRFVRKVAQFGRAK